MGFQFASKSKQTAQHKSSPSPRRTGISLAPPHPVLQLQRTIGNQGVLRLLESQKIQQAGPLADTHQAQGQRADIRQTLHGQRLQPKLTIGEPNDQYEQEADRVADQMMRTPEPQLQRACACGGKCPKCQAEQLGQEHERLQTKRVQASDTGQIAAPPIVNEGLRSPGQPLDSATKAYFEPRFGHDFSKVRVHSDVRASEAAQAVSAKAFTVGQDIVFSTGQYAPNVGDGRRLLGHELTHVVQQRRSIQSNILQKKPRTDAFGKECPNTVVIGSIKPIAKFGKTLFGSGIRTWLGIYSYMKVGPKNKYDSCITEVLKVEKNTCGKKGKLAGYKPCTPKKYCLPVGGTKAIPTDPDIFLDMHRTSRKFNLLGGSGQKTCEVTCLQRYGCGRKEIGRFYVTRTFKAATFKDGKKDVPITLGSISKVIATRPKSAPAP